MGVFKGSRKERAKNLKSIDIKDDEEIVINVYKGGILVSQHFVYVREIEININIPKGDFADANAQLAIY